LIVLDASAALDLILPSPLSQRIRPALFHHEGEVRSPHLIDLEVLSGLRRQLALREIDIHLARRAREDFEDLQIQRYPHQPFQNRIWELRNNLSPYDAAYVVLAESLDCQVLSTDARLAASPGMKSRIFLVEV